MGVPLRIALGTIGLAATLWLAELAGAAPGQPRPPKPLTSADVESPAAASVLPVPPPAPPAEPVKNNLVVATKVFKPFVMQEDGGKLSGFTIELWDAVAAEMHVTTTFHMTQSVRELLSTVSNGDADVGAAGITITAEREKSVNFSYPYFESGLRILVKQAPVSSPIVVLKTLFSQGLLQAVGAVMAVVLVVAHIMWLAERHKSPEQFPRTYFKGVWEALWWSAVTVTTVGYGDKTPVGPLGRLVGLIWMFAGMVLISYFTAAVTTELTVSRLEGSIQGPRDLRGKIVAAPEGSTALQYLVDRGVGAQGVTKIEDAYEMLDAGEVDAVVYDAPVLDYFTSHEGNGRFAVVGSIFHQESYGFALTEGSDLRERVDQAMLALRESGAYYRLHRKWFGGED